MDDGNPVGRPAPMEAERHADGQTDCRYRLTGKVLSIKDDDVAKVAFRVIHVGQNPAFVLSDCAWLPDEDRLGCHSARTILLDLGRPALRVVLHRRTEGYIVAPVRRVDVAIGLPAVSSID